jgi:Spy/CpxP family protein refolding chaperone
MKWFIYNVAILIMLCAYVEVHAQNNVPLTRTPEQEAIKQTERMQSELALTSDQFAQIYDINLKYARMRQVSNTRIEAMERIKSKNAEVRQILNYHQRLLLDTKRFDRSAVKKVLDSKSINNIPATEPKSQSNHQNANPRKQGSPPSPEYLLKNPNGPQNGSETKLPFNDVPAVQKK